MSSKLTNLYNCKSVQFALPANRIGHGLTEAAEQPNGGGDARPHASNQDTREGT